MKLPSALVLIFRIAALYAAYKLGQMQERPPAKWPQGALMDGGWKAWRPYAMGIVGASVALALFDTMGGGMGMGRGMGMGMGPDY